jgi:hypothetical protein
MKHNGLAYDLWRMQARKLVNKNRSENTIVFSGVGTDPAMNYMRCYVVVPTH